MASAAPLILVDPLPRTLDAICDPPTRRRLEALGRLVGVRGRDRCRTPRWTGCCPRPCC